MDDILNTVERQLYRTLRERSERQLPLSADEQTQLIVLTHRLEEWDTTNLAQATARVQSEAEALQHQNHILRELMERKRRTTERMEAMLTELTAEQEVIDAEIARLLSPSEFAELTAPSTH